MAMVAQTSLPEKLEEGDFRRLGAIANEEGTNFALFSAHAERVELCFYDESGQNEIGRFDLPSYTNEVWHGFAPGVLPGALYGYRVHGPFDPAAGHRFNPSKLLLDPYARAIVGDIKWDKAHYSYDPDSEEKDLSFNTLDSGPFMPKCQVTGDLADWGDDKRPDIAWDKVIFYETHVRGYTKHHPAVPEHLRGTFAGLGEQAVVDHIRKLGVTSVELLPIHTFLNDHHLESKGLRNYWGYNSIGFFAPHPAYLGQAGLAGWQTMVRALHDAGIEVILDVVYNHTAEGNELGPHLSFKGIDNASYYRLMPDNPRFYINDTGTGNTYNTSHPRALQLVLDSLRFWVDVMHVDGFRFDLGTILGREPDGFDQGSGFFDAIGQDPLLSNVKLIGEPWDIGPGGYQVGGFPPGWAEWNDKFRDTVRSYWKGDFGLLRDFAARVTGSGDVYDLRGRAPWAGVNFLTAHDGFTLNDVVSYNEKHNEANGEDGKDGHGDNKSYNYGVEGPTDDQSILDVRERQKKNLLATLLLSHGTPMVLAGDEFGRTQDGNNNTYCQDNELNWLDWDIPQAGQELIAFTQKLIALRASRPMLRRASFRDGMIIEWLSPAGRYQSDDEWSDPGARCIGLWLKTPDEQEQDRDELIVLYNAHDGEVTFSLPERDQAKSWRVLLTSVTVTGEPDVVETGETIELEGRSFTVLE